MEFRRHNTRDYVKHILLDKILDGIYKPGQRLVELQIARDLDISQGPVREALRDLEALGVVKSERYRGTRVRSISEREIRESHQIRALLEELAAQLAAPKLKNNAKELELEYAAMIAAAKSGNWDKYYNHAMNFHKFIVQASDNQVLFVTWQSVVYESKYKLTVLSRTKMELQRIATAHGPVLEALKNGDGRTAGRFLRQLIQSFHFSHAEPPVGIPG